MRSHTASKLWLTKKAFEKVLHAVVPSLWVPEYTLVSFTNTPYHDARKRVAKQDRYVMSHCLYDTHLQHCLTYTL
jgi:hypothetical protein